MIQKPFSADAIMQQLMAGPLKQLEFTERETGVSCPACQQALFIGHLEQIKVAACKGCQGILIENEALAIAIRDERASYSGPDNKPQLLDPSQLQINRDCPSCGDKLETHPYCGPGNAVIDSCACCRLVWLDGGEFDSIIRAPGRR